MTDSTENGTPTKPNKSRNSNSSVQIQIKPKSRFEFVLRDTGNSEFLDVVDFGDVVCSVKSVILVMGMSVLDRQVRDKRYVICYCGVSSINRLLKIIGLFCKRTL